MFNRPTFNETLTGELYAAIPNEIGKWKKAPSFFKYRYLDKKEKHMYRPLKGMITEESRLFITCTNLNYEINVGDKIKLNDNDYMIVDSYGVIYDDKKMLNMGKFDSTYLTSKLPKAISLKN